MLQVDTYHIVILVFNMVDFVVCGVEWRVEGVWCRMAVEGVRCWVYCRCVVWDVGIVGCNL